MSDCDALMWNWDHTNPKDVLFARQLTYSLETMGKKVFPDSRTCWHFDDKVGQKYLLEAVGAPLVPSYVFYDKDEAIAWTERTEFPKVRDERVWRDSLPRRTPRLEIRFASSRFSPEAPLRN